MVNNVQYIRCAGTLCRLTDEFCQDPKQFLRLSDKRVIDEEKRLILTEEERRTSALLVAIVNHVQRKHLKVKTLSFLWKRLSTLLNLDFLCVCVSGDHSHSAVQCTAVQPLRR